jgi:hypothetical protein
MSLAEDVPEETAAERDRLDELAHHLEREQEDRRAPADRVLGLAREVVEVPGQSVARDADVLDVEEDADR